MKRAAAETVPPSSKNPQQLGFSFQEDLWFGDFDDDAARAAAANSMAAMAGRIMGARPFPAAAQRLVQLTRSEDTNIQKVVRVLESDPGLSQRVLRLVNSAGYGLRVRCTSLNHATALLGQQRLQQIATSAVLLNHFGRTSEETKRKQEHGALVASLCRYLAIHLGLPQEDLFTCGLLHDLGQLMMLDEGNNEYRELVRMHEDQWDALHISEREIMGFDHAVLAAHVLASWSIPAPVPEVIALHHQPALAHHRGSKIAAMVQTLRFADHMSHLLEHCSEAQGSKLLADSEAASYLGFSEMQIAAMWKDLRQLHEANRTRRMDIQDVAPRSLSIPASLSPRAVPFTEPPDNYEPPSIAGPPRSLAPQQVSFAPPANPAPRVDAHPSSPTTPAQAANDAAPGYSEAPETMNSLRPEPEPVTPSVRISAAPLSARSEQEVLRLSEATPIARATHYVEKASAPDEYFEHEASARYFENQRFEEDYDDERPSVMGAEPEVFPCALCYGPTFGAQCPVCAAHVCTAHQTTEREWCMACDDEFYRFRREHEVGSFFRIASGTAMGVSVLSSAVLGGWELGFGVLGICLTTGLAGYAGYQGYLKARFKRNRSPLDDAPPTLYTPNFDKRKRRPNAPASTAESFESLDQWDSAQVANAAAYEKPAIPEKSAVSERFISGEHAIESQRVVEPENFPEPRIAERVFEAPTPQMHSQPGLPSNVLHLGEAVSRAHDEGASQSTHSAVTIPAPSVTRAREREESLRAEQAEPANNFSWPPSQDAPPTSQRTSFLPRPDIEDVPLMSLSEPPVPMLSEEEQFEAPHRAIAPPSMASEPESESEGEGENASASEDYIPEAPAPYFTSTSEVPADAPDFTMEPVEDQSSKPPGSDVSEKNCETPEDHVLAAQSQRSVLPPQLRTEPPMCQGVSTGAVAITPPVIHRQMEFCTAPSGTVQIRSLELHAPGQGLPPENDQNSQQASGEL